MFLFVTVSLGSLSKLTQFSRESLQTRLSRNIFFILIHAQDYHTITTNKFLPVCPIPSETVSQCRNATFPKGKRWSGAKDLERQPLSISIQGRQPYKNILFSFNAGLPYLKDPRSKALEPDCLFPPVSELRHSLATGGVGNTKGAKATLLRRLKKFKDPPCLN